MGWMQITYWEGSYRTTRELVTGDVFIIEPGKIVKPIFHTDCELIVVKVPSIPGDKYVLE